jgi:hypothetical protein
MHDCQLLPCGAAATSLLRVAASAVALTAWEGTLDDDEIQAVSAYVYDQATGDKW